jgi:hypothetical protein
MGAAEKCHRGCGQQKAEADHENIAAALQGERRNRDCKHEYEGPEDRTGSSRIRLQ